MLLKSRGPKKGAGDSFFYSTVESRLLPAVQSSGGVLQKEAPQVKKVDYKVTYKTFVVRTPPADPNWPQGENGAKVRKLSTWFPSST